MSTDCPRDWALCHRSYCQREHECGERAASAPAERPAPSPEQAEPVAWRCFHCDEVFVDRDAAREHFGPTEHDRPGCQYDVAHIRWMEAQHRRNVDDDSEALRTIGGLIGEHERLRRRAEEQGYERGLRDAKRWPAELGLQLIPVQPADGTERHWEIQADGSALPVVRAAAPSAQPEAQAEPVAWQARQDASAAWRDVDAKTADQLEALGWETRGLAVATPTAPQVQAEGWVDNAVGENKQRPVQMRARPQCRDCADFGPICPADGKPCAPVPAGWTDPHEALPAIGEQVLVYSLQPWEKAPSIKLDTWDEQREAPLSFSTETIPIGPGWDEHDDFEAVLAWMRLPTVPPMRAPENTR
jgi:hypothetical protein